MGGQFRFFYSSCAAEDTGGSGSRSNDGDASFRWRDVYASLIADGHPPDRLGRYTERQLKLYYDAAQRRERHHRADLFLDVRAALGADKQQAKDHLRSLKKD